VSATSITVTPEQVGDTQSCHISGELWTHFVNYDLAFVFAAATKIRDRSSRWLVYQSLTPTVTAKGLI